MIFVATAVRTPDIAVLLFQWDAVFKGTCQKVSLHCDSVEALREGLILSINNS
jgi:hypothetical protein